MAITDAGKPVHAVGRGRRAGEMLAEAGATEIIGVRYGTIIAVSKGTVIANEVIA